MKNFKMSDFRWFTRGQFSKKIQKNLKKIFQKLNFFSKNRVISILHIGNLSIKNLTFFFFRVYLSIVFFWVGWGTLKKYSPTRLLNLPLSPPPSDLTVKEGEKKFSPPCEAEGGVWGGLASRGKIFTLSVGGQDKTNFYTLTKQNEKQKNFKCSDSCNIRSD